MLVATSATSDYFYDVSVSAFAPVLDSLGFYAILVPAFESVLDSLGFYTTPACAFASEQEYNRGNISYESLWC